MAYPDDTSPMTPPPMPMAPTQQAPAPVTSTGIQGSAAQQPQGQQLASAAPKDYSDMINNWQPPQTQQTSQPQQAVQPVQNADGSKDYSNVIDNWKPQQANQSNGGQQPTPDSSKDNWFMQKVDQFNYAGDMFGLGTLKRLNQGINSIPGIGSIGSDIPGQPSPGPDAYGQTIDKVIADKKAAYNAAWQADPGVGSYIASGLGKVFNGGTVGLLAAAAAPEVAASSPYLFNAAVGAGMGYTDPSNSSLETAVKTGLGGAIGAAVPLGMKIGGGLLNKWWNPEGAASDTIGSVVAGDPQAPAKLAEANQMTKVYNDNAVNTGQQPVNLSAGSVFNGQPGSYGPKEGTLHPTLEQQNQIVRPQLMGDAQNVKTNLINTIGDMASPADAAASKAAYANLKINGEYVAPDGSITNDVSQAQLPAAISQHPLFNQYNAPVANPLSEAYKGIPDNSIAQLQTIKSDLGQNIYAHEQALAAQQKPPMSNDEYQASKDLMGNINPILQQSNDYNTANSLAQKVAIQQGYNNKLGTINLDNTSLKSLNNTLFPGDAAKAQFLKDVETTGGDPNLAKATMYMSDKLGNSPMLNKLNSAYKEAKMDTSGGTPMGSINSGILRGVQDKFSSRYSNALLDMTLNQSKWAPMIKQALSQASAPARTDAFANVVHQAMFAVPTVLGAQFVNNTVNKAVDQKDQ